VRFSSNEIWLFTYDRNPEALEEILVAQLETRHYTGLQKGLEFHIAQ
jgi:hypothetical protein